MCGDLCNQKCIHILEKAFQQEPPEAISFGYEMSIVISMISGPD